jgi:hypothetical protein
MEQTQVVQLQEQLAIKEQENQQLVAQLAHLRSWMNSLQQRARANDPHALLVARELYVGGVPEGTTEVRAASQLGGCWSCCCSGVGPRARPTPAAARERPAQPRVACTLAHCPPTMHTATQLE